MEIEDSLSPIYAFRASFASRFPTKGQFDHLYLFVLFVLEPAHHTKWYALNSLSALKYKTLKCGTGSRSDRRQEAKEEVVEGKGFVKTSSSIHLCFQIDILTYS